MPVLSNIKLKLLGVVELNIYIRVIWLLCVSLMATHALSQDLSGWSDKTVCRLVKATPDNVEYRTELTSRGLSCGDAIKSSQPDNDLAPNIDSELFDGWILADEAKEMFDNHVKQSALLKVPLPSVNRVIKDYKRLEEYRTQILANNYHYTSYLWKEEVGGLILTKAVCMKIMTEFKVPTVGGSNAKAVTEEFAFKRCDAALMDYSVINFDEGIKLYKELILAIATAKPDHWTYKDSGKNDFNPRDYNVWGVLSTITMFYAVNYDRFDYTDEEHKVIENYLKSKAMKERLDRDGNRSRTALCPITDPMRLSAVKHKVNNCGSVRFRFAPAELALATVMQDQELWAKGLWDLDYTLSMIEKEGFFVPLSAKGCKALGYTWDTSKLLSLNVEMLKLADFNLLDYKTRHGKTVAEAYEMLFKQYEDITISNHIAKKGVGSASCGTKPYKTHEEFLYYELGIGVNPDKLLEAYDQGFVPTHEDFVNWSIRFVAEKHPEWLNEINTLNEVNVQRMGGAYYTIQPFEIYNANIMSESGNIWEKKKPIWEEKQRQIEIIRLEKQRQIEIILEEKKAKNRIRLKNNALKIKANKAEELLKQKAKQIEKVSKLAIFNFKDGSFSLTLDQVDFIESELPQKQNMNNGFELHKASINGQLQLSSNAQVGFRTLVYQKLMFQENRLSINVSEMTDPEMNPFKRHRKPLQKKCGVGLMDEWDWLSFITKTSDIKTAKNQQCHYDYFKEANDKPAWELFQTVLGGTDSILGYLQTNVER